MKRTARTALAALALAGAATAFAAPAHADGTSTVQGWTTSSVPLYASCDNTSNSTAEMPAHEHFTATVTPPAKQYATACYEVSDDFGRHGFTPNAYYLVTIPASTSQVFNRWVTEDAKAVKEHGAEWFGIKTGDDANTLYVGPGSGFDKAGKMDDGQTMQAGTPVDVSGNAWIPVKGPDGNVLFVAEAAVKPSTAPAPATQAPASPAAKGSAPQATAAAAPATAAPAAAMTQDDLADKALGLIPGNKTLWVTVSAVEGAIIFLILGLRQKRREARAAQAEAEAEAPRQPKAGRPRRHEPEAPAAEPEAGNAPTLISLD